MNEFIRILERATLQHLSYQMRDNNTLLVFNPDSFTSREEKAYNQFQTELSNQLTEEQISKIELIINNYIGELSEIYFNMGIKTGAKLLNQLLNESDRDF